MRAPIIALTIGLMAAPAFADDAPSDTVTALIANGASIESQGTMYEFSYKEDGSYTETAMGMDGSYTAKGDTLCITPDALGQEICIVLPGGKASGDTFEVTTDMGPANVTLK